jgi:hypothetical protein
LPGAFSKDDILMGERDLEGEEMGERVKIEGERGWEWDLPEGLLGPLAVSLFSGGEWGGLLVRGEAGELPSHSKGLL